MTRVDFDIIASFIHSNARVLDVGCGDGALLQLLGERQEVDGRGVELSQQGVDTCLVRGLSVVQGDADHDLVYYPDNGFDYVILSQTLQATRNPRHVLEELLRIGRRVIVSIPNFGYWRVRASLMFRGQMPVTRELPYSWYDTPNIHFCTIADFLAMAGDVGAKVERVVVLKRSGERLNYGLPRSLWNLLGQQAVFLLQR